MLSTLQDVTARLIAGYDPERVILFGSRARADARPDSDFDLLIIKETDAPRLQRRMQVDTLLFDRAIALDLDVLTPAEMLFLYRKGAPLVTEIVETGKVLYVRDITESWLFDAAQELKAAEILLAAQQWKAACLHAQQAAEKSLEALILEKGGTLQRIHDLAPLIRQLASLGVVAEITVDDAVFLSNIYRGRYPAEDGLLPHGDPSGEDASRAVSAAGQLLAQARRAA